MACREVDIEPCYKSVYEVVTSRRQLKGYREGKISRCAGVEIKSQDCGGVCHSRFDFYCINERLGQGSLLQRGVVKPVDVIPDCN